MIICDFCGKTQKEVNRIIAGPKGVAICGKCVLTSAEIVIKEMTIQYDNMNANACETEKKRDCESKNYTFVSDENGSFKEKEDWYIFRK